MNALLVLSNPYLDSFSKRIAEEMNAALQKAGHTVEIADLQQEDFDPRMSAADIAHYKGHAHLPDSVLREQQRIDRADALMIAFPIYWWSMPALLKGWIDRVFTHGWAYGVQGDGKLKSLLRDRPVHLFATGAGSASLYHRHGYEQAMQSQIVHGIFDYCGFRDVRLHLLLDVESRDDEVREKHLRVVNQVASTLFSNNSLAPELAATP